MESIALFCALERFGSSPIPVPRGERAKPGSVRLLQFGRRVAFVFSMGVWVSVFFFVLFVHQCVPGAACVCVCLQCVCASWDCGSVRNEFLRVSDRKWLGREMQFLPKTLEGFFVCRLVYASFFFRTFSYRTAVWCCIFGAKSSVGVESLNKPHTTVSKTGGRVGETKPTRWGIRSSGAISATDCFVLYGIIIFRIHFSLCFPLTNPYTHIDTHAHIWPLYWPKNNDQHGRRPPCYGWKRMLW